MAIVKYDEQKRELSIMLQKQVREEDLCRLTKLLTDLLDRPLRALGNRMEEAMKRIKSESCQSRRGSNQPQATSASSMRDSRSHN
jgi:hypothetical protein